MGEEGDRKEDCKVFVGGLNLETTNESLNEYFSQYGELSDCIVMVDSEGKSRGFGFVTYTTQEQRKKCVDGNPHTVDGKLVEVKKAVPREGSSRTAATKKVFLGGLPLDATEEDIKKPLEELEFNTDEVEIKIMTEKGTEKPRGFAFATFKSYDDVDVLCKQGHLIIKEREVEVKKAVPKDVLERKNADSYDRGYGGRGQHSYGGGRYDPYRPYPPAGGYDYSRYPGAGGGYMGGGGYYGDRMAASGYPGSAYAASAYGRYPQYGGGYASYGSMYGQPLAGSMGSYSQTNSSYGPSRGAYSDKEKSSHGYHPYSR